MLVSITVDTPAFELAQMLLAVLQPLWPLIKDHFRQLQTLFCAIQQSPVSQRANAS